jgi:hypothetical protein
MGRTPRTLCCSVGRTHALQKTTPSKRYYNILLPYVMSTHKRCVALLTSGVHAVVVLTTPPSSTRPRTLWAGGDGANQLRVCGRRARLKMTRV